MKVCDICGFIPKCQDARGLGMHKKSHLIPFNELRKDRSRRIHLVYKHGHRCMICGTSEWMNLPIPLELDHISGDTDDNREENLRVICPNCHAQTPTYKAKNRASYKRRLMTEKYPRPSRLASVSPLPSKQVKG